MPEGSSEDVVAETLFPQREEDEEATAAAAPKAPHLSSRPTPGDALPRDRQPGQGEWCSRDTGGFGSQAETGVRGAGIFLWRGGWGAIRRGGWRCRGGK